MRYGAWQTETLLETWQHLGLEFWAEFWDDLVMEDLKPTTENPTFTVVAVYDPYFEDPC